jgi:hypothetical protein
VIYTHHDIYYPLLNLVAPTWYAGLGKRVGGPDDPNHNFEGRVPVDTALQAPHFSSASEKEPKNGIVTWLDSQQRGVAISLFNYVQNS